MNTNINIVVLDSGADITHPIFSKSNVEILPLTDCNDFIDNIGHGTAVCSILSKYSNASKIYIGKVIDENIYVDVSKLIKLLWYIYYNVKCDIINLSLGVLYHNAQLQDVCYALNKKGVIIVSAFDNGGAVSYPASYSSVIGVDASARCINKDDFVFVENSIVNLKAKGGVQRVPWKNHSYILAQGASFATPYVTAKISSLLYEDIKKSKKTIMEYIKAISRFVYNFPELKEINNFTAIKNFKNTAIFPYNKETHSLVNFSELLNFKIHGVYDTKFSGHIGKEVFFNNQKNIIKNINSLNFKEIDSLVIGHINEIEIFTNQNIKKGLLEKCLQNKVNVYCFDSINNYSYENLFNMKGLYFGCPQIENKMLPKNNFGKLHQPKTPILAVFGTSKQQGKFTLQLELRKRFKHMGYSIAQLGTEPSAPLFNMEYTYPFGYSSNIPFRGEDTLLMSNYIMHKLDIMEADIILTGSQSGTIPMMFDNLGQTTIEQLSFLLGINPDAVILCVNYNDDIEYVNRTIQAIESLSDTTVISISLFPAYSPNGWFQASNRKVAVPDKLLNEYRNKLYNKLHIPIYTLGNKSEVDSMFEECLNFFQE